MVKVTVKFKADNQAIKQLELAQKTALAKTGTALIARIQELGIVPYNIGELQRSAFIDESQLERLVIALIYDQPYARRLYWHPEYNFRKDKNPNAQGKWMERFITGEDKDWVKNTFMKLFKEEAKGLIK